MNHNSAFAAIGELDDGTLSWYEAAAKDAKQRGIGRVQFQHDMSKVLLFDVATQSCRRTRPAHAFVMLRSWFETHPVTRRERKANGGKANGSNGHIGNGIGGVDGEFDAEESIYL